MTNSQPTSAEPKRTLAPQFNRPATPLRLCLLLTLIALPSTFAFNMTWTGTNGATIEAELVSYSFDGSSVVLRKTDGLLITGAVASLQNFYRNLEIQTQAVSNYFLGLKYKIGYKGVRQDFKTAIDCFYRAASCGYPDAVYELGLAFESGTGVPRDMTKARYYYQQAAKSGHADAQNNLACLLGRGDGGEKDEELALFWTGKAAAAGNPHALMNLGNYEEGKGNSTLAADYYLQAGIAFLTKKSREGALRAVDALLNVGATELAKQLRRKIDPSRPQSSILEEPPTPESTGTAWFCTPTNVVTCWHVLEGHTNYYIRSEKFPRTPLRLLAKDRANDLAILELATPAVRNEDFLSLSRAAAAIGEQVFTIGFPHIDILGEAAKYTDGTVTSASGLDDDPRTLQISVPVQAGNSGGPLLNDEGQVVGIVASKLAAARVFEWTGDLPQNVNYAIKQSYLQSLLDSKGLQCTSGSRTQSLRTRSQLVERAQRAVMVIVAD